MKEKETILIVDDTPNNVNVILDYLSKEGYRILVAESGESALEQIQYARPDLILLDVMMPKMDGFETCRKIRQIPGAEDIPVIFITALSNTVEKVKGFQAGAVDYITKPMQYEEVVARVNTHLALRRLQSSLMNSKETLEKKVEERTQELKEALEEVKELKNQLEAENIYLKQEIKLEHNFEEIITQSKLFREVLLQVEQVAGTSATVLILGETGTGKELLARAIHSAGKRKNQPLVKVNCAALPANLIESELFGHEKGAFTGALNRKIGRFELADKGTIFLDEIGELPLELQSKILRVLQEGEIDRLGSTRTTQVDVRVIAATNRDLEKEIDAGNFRADLYYRLNVFPLKNPPLRDRKEDISVLAIHFVKKYGGKIGKLIKNIPKKVIARFENYDWPGNIRELENIIERAVIISQGDTLEVGNWLNRTGNVKNENKLLTLAENEKQHILEVLKITKGQISGDKGAAKILGLKPTTLRSRMEKLGLQPQKK